MIGVVTSPTGAVIRDILHRLEDRFPRRVLVWPVRVQGETSAAEVAAAIRGFNALEPGGPIPRPDVLIVARGGGSIEDLWGFNEEIVVRAAAESAIPLVSAVGHETDTTLIDYAADMRAPTPTGAAEMVVPVRVELMAAINDLARRHVEAALRLVERRRSDLRATARALPSPDALISPKRQRLDLAATRLYPALARNARGHEERLLKVARQLAHVSPVANVARMRARLDAVGPRPYNAVCRSILLREESLKQIGRRLVVSRETLLRAERTRLAQAHDLTQRVAERLGPALQGQIARKADRLDAGLEALRQPELQIGAQARLRPRARCGRAAAELGRCRSGRPGPRARIRRRQGRCHRRADRDAAAAGGKPKLAVADEQGALF